MEALLAAKASLAPRGSLYLANLGLCVLEYALVNAAMCWGRWPPRSTLRRQVSLSLRAAPWYALLPTAVERAALLGLTRLHAGAPSLAEVAAFLAAAEVLVYAVHRGLHESVWLYARVHRTHHEFKTSAQLSPFASLAFAPLDGLAQASPYALLAFLLPCNLLAFEAMLFFTGVWSSLIHSVDAFRSGPGVLGARHHTLHHVHGRCNYGQFTTLCDWAGGTLKEPPSPTRS